MLPNFSQSLGGILVVNFSLIMSDFIAEVLSFFQKSYQRIITYYIWNDIKFFKRIIGDLPKELVLS